MRATIAGVITFVIIGLFFLPAAKVDAVVEINGKCMDDCHDKGNAKGFCIEQCSSQSNSVAPIEKKPTGYECIVKCRNQGSTPDFCKSLCSQ